MTKKKQKSKQHWVHYQSRVADNLSLYCYWLFVLGV